MEEPTSRKQNGGVYNRALEASLHLVESQSIPPPQKRGKRTKGKDHSGKHNDEGKMTTKNKSKGTCTVEKRRKRDARRQPHRSRAGENNGRFSKNPDIRRNKRGGKPKEALLRRGSHQFRATTRRKRDRRTIKCNGKNDSPRYVRGPSLK